MTNQALTAAPQEKPWIEYYTFSRQWYPKSESEYLKSHTITKVGAAAGRALGDFVKLLVNFLISIPNAIVWTGRHICCCSPRQESQSVADLSTPDDLSPPTPTGTIANLNKDDEDSAAANTPPIHTNNEDNSGSDSDSDSGSGTSSSRSSSTECLPVPSSPLSAASAQPVLSLHQPFRSSPGDQPDAAEALAQFGDFFDDISKEERPESPSFLNTLHKASYVGDVSPLLSATSPRTLIVTSVDMQSSGVVIGESPTALSSAVSSDSILMADVSHEPNSPRILPNLFIPISPSSNNISSPRELQSDPSSPLNFANGLIFQASTSAQQIGESFIASSRVISQSSVSRSSSLLTDSGVQIQVGATSSSPHGEVDTSVTGTSQTGQGEMSRDDTTATMDATEYDMPTDKKDGTYAKLPKSDEEGMGAGSAPCTGDTTAKDLQNANAKFNEFSDNDSDDESEGTPTNQGVKHNRVATPRPVTTPPMAQTFHPVHHREATAYRVSTPKVQGNGSFTFVNNSSNQAQMEKQAVSTSTTSPNTISPFSINVNVFGIPGETPLLSPQSPIELTSQTAAAPLNSASITTASKKPALTVEIPQDVSDASLSPQYTPFHDALSVEALDASSSLRSPVRFNSMLWSSSQSAELLSSNQTQAQDHIPSPRPLSESAAPALAAQYQMQQFFTFANVTNNTLAAALLPQQEAELVSSEVNAKSNEDFSPSSRSPKVEKRIAAEPLPDVTVTEKELQAIYNEPLNEGFSPSSRSPKVEKSIAAKPLPDVTVTEKELQAIYDEPL